MKAKGYATPNTYVAAIQEHWGMLGVVVGGVDFGSLVANVSLAGERPPCGHLSQVATSRARRRILVHKGMRSRLVSCLDANDGYSVDARWAEVVVMDKQRVVDREVKVPANKRDPSITEAGSADSEAGDWRPR